MRGDLESFERYLPVKTIRQVDHQYVIGYRDWRRTNGMQEGKRNICARTINKEVTTLRSMLNKGVAWKMIGFNPLDGLKAIPHTKLVKDRRPLSIEEVRALMKASPAPLAFIWRLLVRTGMRKAELSSLLFSDIDYERKSLTVRADMSKSGKSREIDLDDYSLAEIAKLQAAAPHRKPSKLSKMSGVVSHDHVFVTRRGCPWKTSMLAAFYACCKRAGIDDAHSAGSVDIHSLRGTCATLAIENGASPKAIQEILGHSTLAMTMAVYTRATSRSKRDALAAIPLDDNTTAPPDHVVEFPMKAAKTAEPTLLIRAI